MKRIGNNKQMNIPRSTIGLDKWIREEATLEEISAALIEMPPQLYFLLHSDEKGLCEVLKKLKSNLPKKDIKHRLFKRIYRTGIEFGNVAINYERDEKNNPRIETWNFYDKSSKRGKIIRNVNLDASVPSYDWETYSLEYLQGKYFN